MQQEKLLKQKVMDLSLEVVKICSELSEENREEFILENLMRRMGRLGAWANMNAKGGEQPMAFIFNNPCNEANMIMYWLELMAGSGMIENAVFEKMRAQWEDLLEILDAQFPKMSFSEMDSELEEELMN